MELFSKQPAKSKSKINKCPHCGAVLTPTSTVCPDCNAEVSGLSASCVIEDFSAQIKNASSLFSRTSVVSVIESFPIPASRNDLLELLAFLAPKIKPALVGKKKKDAQAIREAEAYYHKFSECLLKAKTYYSQDPAFDQYIKVDELHAPAKKWWKFALVALSIIGFICILLFLLEEFDLLWY